MYAGAPNEGMRCIQEIIDRFSESHLVSCDTQIYDVRKNQELPNLSADVFISSGGPGSPLAEGEQWDHSYREWLLSLIEYNSKNNIKKPAFFICHSFQLACRHLGIGEISKRAHTSFGIFPVHQTNKTSPIFNGLENPFHAFDNRDYQVTYDGHLHELSQVLAVENMEQTNSNAIMAIQFNECMWGTQFHPEADAKGMLSYLQRDERKEQIIQLHGLHTWEEMMQHAQNPVALNNTRNNIIPNFLTFALECKYPNT